MPAQKRLVPDDSEEEPQRRPPRCSPPPPPPPSQLNGNSHHHGATEAPSENDVAREPKEDEEEEEEEEREGKEGDVEAEAEEEEDEDAMKQEEDEEEDDENGDGEEDEDEDEEDEEEDEEDSDQTSSSDDDEEKPEFVYVELADIRKEVQCPICLGIIKKTRTVMECLHRFCRECIDKSMRMGNNECPACRTHCASRRSLRDDPNYDALIAALYPDIDKYEEEELAFHEEERTRNKQIQASIAQIFQRQSEALARRRTIGKETSGQLSTRPQRRPTRRRSRGDFQGSEENEDENDDKGAKDSSSADERSTEGRRRRKRRTGVRTSQPSTSADPDGGSVENGLEAGRENRGVSPGLAWSAEMLAWGRGGARSHTRHGNSSVGNNKNSRSTRLTKLVEYLRSVEEKHEELDIHLKLISLDQKGSPSLQQPYLCCRPSLSIKHLCEYVAHQTPWQAEEVEILLIKGRQNPDDVHLSCSSMLTDELQILKDQETLSGLATNCTTNRGRLILAYRRKETS